MSSANQIIGAALVLSALVVAPLLYVAFTDRRWHVRAPAFAYAAIILACAVPLALLLGRAGLKALFA